MKFFITFISLILASPIAIAAPGAHGPDGEHLDAPGGHVHSDVGPRIDTFTESFELVGYLQEDELSILIDRYETNEPVLGGKLEVEFNGLKAPAKFHADHGDYAVDDPQFLKALAKPGKHPLIFTLTAGEDSDLLEGTLEVKAQADTHEHGHFPWKRAVAALLVVAVLVIVILSLRRRKFSSGKT